MQYVSFILSGNNFEIYYSGKHRGSIYCNDLYRALSFEEYDIIRTGQTMMFINIEKLKPFIV